MIKNETLHFNHLFWFCVGVFLLSFGAMTAMIFIPVPEINREMASNAQGFLQGSLMMSAIGFLLSGSPSTRPKVDPIGSTTTIDLQATTTTEPKEDEKPI